MEVKVFVYSENFWERVIQVKTGSMGENTGGKYKLPSELSQSETDHF